MFLDKNLICSRQEQPGTDWAQSTLLRRKAPLYQRGAPSARRRALPWKKPCSFLYTVREAALPLSEQSDPVRRRVREGCPGSSPEKEAERWGDRGGAASSTRRELPEGREVCSACSMEKGPQHPVTSAQTAERMPQWHMHLNKKLHMLTFACRLSLLCS